MKKSDFPYYLSKFFQSYLPGSRNVSGNTILSYRDTFTKLLTYLRDVCSIAPDKVSFRNLDRKTIESFLSYLEIDQGCSISTRNQRLAGLKSFFRFAEVERPDLLADCQSILLIKNKKFPRPVIDYLSGLEMESLLGQPDTSTARGRRDLALLSLMYDSAARVQEICDLKAGSVRLDGPAVVRLYGKGRKTRDARQGTFRWMRHAPKYSGHIWLKTIWTGRRCRICRCFSTAGKENFPGAGFLLSFQNISLLPTSAAALSKLGSRLTACGIQKQCT